MKGKKRGKKHVCLRFLSFVLAAALLFSLAACGGAEDGSGSQESSLQEKESEAEAAEKAQLAEDEANGLFLLVNKEHHIDADYVPEDLEPIRYYASDRNANSRYMRAEAADHFHELVEAAAAEGIDIVMTTAYRSYEFQEILWNYNVSEKGEEEANKTSARPGESEHQTGLAVDLSTSEIDYRNSYDFENTAAGKWVAENAHRFGFIIRFPKDGTDITGYSYEPWHLRYVGRTAAADIYGQNLTLEEYVEQMGF